MFENINWIAVVVAAIASFVLGYLWYGPVFGKQWMAMMGYTPESMKAMKMTPGTAMTWGFITSLVMAFVVAGFVNVFGAVGVSGALSLAFWLWLGFIATVMLGSVLWENRSMKLYCFNAIYQFVSVFLMALIVVLWR